MVQELGMFVAQLIRMLARHAEVLSLILCMDIQIFSLSTWEVEGGGLGVQGSPQLHSLRPGILVCVIRHVL